MLGSVANVVLDVDFSGKTAIKRAERSLESYRNKLTEVAAANSTTAQAARDNADAQTKLGESSDGSRRGLAGLSNQLQATRKAQDALRNSTNSLTETFDQLGNDDHESQLKTIEALTDSLHGNLDDINTDLGHRLSSTLNEEFDEREFKNVLEYTAGLRDNLDDIDDGDVVHAHGLD